MNALDEDKHFHKTNLDKRPRKRKLLSLHMSFKMYCMRYVKYHLSQIERVDGFSPIHPAD